MNNGAESLDKAKENLTHLASDAKAAGGTIFDHAKGAAAAAYEAGTKAAENVYDEKLKEAEHVRPFFSYRKKKYWTFSIQCENICSFYKFICSLTDIR